MKTKQKYYHLIKPIIFVLFLSFSMASCEKEDIIPESPDIEDTENPTDTDPNEIVPPILLYGQIMSKRYLCISLGRTI